MHQFNQKISKPESKIISHKVMRKKNDIVEKNNFFKPSIQTKNNTVPEKKESFFAPKIQLKPQEEIIQKQASSTIQDNIIAAAESKKGKIKAKQYENNAQGSANNLSTKQYKREGYKELIEIFDIAAPGVWSHDALTYDNTVNVKSMPSWCGIFATYATKKGGGKVGTWSIGKSIPTIDGFKPVPKEKVQKGDSGIKKDKLVNEATGEKLKPLNHHFLVKEVSGDKKTIKTLDGNSGMYSEVVEKPFWDVAQVNGFFRPENVIQTQLKIGGANDVYEQEANRVADYVVQSPTYNNQNITHNAKEIQRMCTKCDDDKVLRLKRGGPSPPKVEKRVQKQDSSVNEFPNTPNYFENLQHALQINSTRGSPLPVKIKQEMEQKIGADFSNVKIHTGNTATHLNKNLNAHAFAYGNNIYFNDGKFNPDTSEGRHLLAHELTHTIQQGASPIVQRKTEIKNNSPPQIQKSGQEEESWGEQKVWEFVGKYVPANILQVIRDIRHQGIFTYVKNKITAAVTSVFDSLGIDPKIIDQAQQLFNTLKPIVTEVINGLRRNDCRPLFAALKKLKDILNKILGDAWQKISKKLEPVVKYLEDIWQTYAAPAIDKIKAFASQVWEKFKELAGKAWNLFKDHVRNQGRLIMTGWNMLKGWLGINDSETDNSEGFVDWVKRKLGEVWEQIKQKLAPIIEPVKKVIKTINELLPWNFIRTLQEKATKFLEDVGKMAGNMEAEDDAVATQQVSFRNQILPAVKNRVVQLSDAIIDAGKWVGGKVTALTGSVSGFVTKISSIDILSPVKNIINPISEKVNEIGEWAHEKVIHVFDSIGKNVLLINKFIEPILNMLTKIVGVIGNVLGKITDFILGPFKLIPKCISDPIMNWLIENVIKKIPILGSLFTLPEHWPKIKQTALHVLKAVFVDGNLRKALWLLFSAGLKILGIPPTLVTNILKKAAAVFGDIIKKPVPFFINLLSAAKEGVLQFFGNIGTNLLTGFKNWLFAELTDNGIALPTEWNFKGILGFVMDIFDINLERFLRVLDEHPKVKGTRIVEYLRRGADWAARALPWVVKLMEKGPKGIWEEFKAKMADIDFVDFIIKGASEWIAQKLVQKAIEWMISLCDVTGITPVIKSFIAIYDTVQELVRRAKQILQLIESVLDGLGAIVKGNIQVGADFVEKALVKALPLGIGLGAAAAGLGSLGRKMKEIMEKINEKIDDVIQKIVHGAVDFLIAAWNAIKTVAGNIRDAIVGWWKARINFTGNDNKPHKIYFRGEENNATLIIESKAMTFSEFLTEFMPIGDDKPVPAGRNKENDKTKAIEHAGKIDEYKAERIGDGVGATEEAKKDDKKKKEEAKKKKVEDKITELSEILKHYFGLDDAENKIENKGMHGSFAKTSEALSLNKKLGYGSQPVGSSPGSYAFIDERRAEGNPGSYYYVRGHLINDNLGGKGQWDNMTPLPGKENTRFEQEFESRIKRAVESGATIRINVSANYDRSPINDTDVKNTISDIEDITPSQEDTLFKIIKHEKDVPTTMTVNANIIRKENAQWQVKESLVPSNTFTVALPQNIKIGDDGYTLRDSAKFIKVNINCGEESEYARLGLSSAQSTQIINALKKRKIPFGAKSTLKNKENNGANLGAIVDNWYYKKGNTDTPKKITFGPISARLLIPDPVPNNTAVATPVAPNTAAATPVVTNPTAPVSASPNASSPTTTNNTT